MPVSSDAILCAFRSVLVNVLTYLVMLGAYFTA